MADGFEEGFTLFGRDGLWPLLAYVALCYAARGIAAREARLLWHSVAALFRGQPPQAVRTEAAAAAVVAAAASVAAVSAAVEAGFEVDVSPAHRAAAAAAAAAAPAGSRRHRPAAATRWERQGFRPADGAKRLPRWRPAAAGVHVSAAADTCTPERRPGAAAAWGAAAVAAGPSPGAFRSTYDTHYSPLFRGPAAAARRQEPSRELSGEELRVREAEAAELRRRFEESLQLPDDVYFSQSPTGNSGGGGGGSALSGASKKVSPATKRVAFNLPGEALEGVKVSCSPGGGGGGGAEGGACEKRAGCGGSGGGGGGQLPVRKYGMTDAHVTADPVQPPAEKPKPACKPKEARDGASEGENANGRRPEEEQQEQPSAAAAASSRQMLNQQRQQQQQQHLLQMQEQQQQYMYAQQQQQQRQQEEQLRLQGQQYAQQREWEMAQAQAQAEYEAQAARAQAQAQAEAEAQARAAQAQADAEQAHQQQAAAAAAAAAVAQAQAQAAQAQAQADAQARQQNQTQFGPGAFPLMQPQVPSFPPACAQAPQAAAAPSSSFGAFAPHSAAPGGFGGPPQPLFFGAAPAPAAQLKTPVLLFEEPKAEEGFFGTATSESSLDLSPATTYYSRAASCERSAWFTAQPLPDVPAPAFAVLSDPPPPAVADTSFAALLARAREAKLEGQRDRRTLTERRDEKKATALKDLTGALQAEQPNGFESDLARRMMDYKPAAPSCGTPAMPRKRQAFTIVDDDDEDYLQTRGLGKKMARAEETWNVSLSPEGSDATNLSRPQIDLEPSEERERERASCMSYLGISSSSAMAAKAPVSNFSIYQDSVCTILPFFFSLSLLPSPLAVPQYHCHLPQATKRTPVRAKRVLGLTMDSALTMDTPQAPQETPDYLMDSPLVERRNQRNPRLAGMFKRTQVLPASPAKTLLYVFLRVAARNTHIHIHSS